MMDKKTTIAEMREIYKTFVDERNWNQFHDPKSVAASISIEANELLELFQWEDSKSAKKKLEDPVMRAKVESEIADIFIYTLNFVNQTGLDLSAAFEKKMEKVREKFKVEHGDNMDEYYKAKASYRKEGKF